MLPIGNVEMCSLSSNGAGAGGLGFSGCVPPAVGVVVVFSPADNNNNASPAELGSIHTGSRGQFCPMREAVFVLSASDNLSSQSVTDIVVCHLSGVASS